MCVAEGERKRVIIRRRESNSELTCLCRLSALIARSYTCLACCFFFLCVWLQEFSLFNMRVSEFVARFII